MDGQQQAQAPAAGNPLGQIRARFQGRTVLTALAAAAVFALVALALWYVVKTLRRTKSVTVQGSRTPVSGEVLSRLPVDTLLMDNGSRMSMTFWLYLHDISKYAGMTRHVFHVGNSDDAKHSAISVTMPDMSSSRLHIQIGSSKTILPYVPAQRWVHVAVVKQDIYSSGRALVFLDGIEQETEEGAAEDTAIGRNLTVSGAMYVGGENVKRVGFSGMVGTTRFYSYDMGYREIMRDYRSGPNSSLLGKLGLGSYGLRTPVYRVA